MDPPQSRLKMDAPQSRPPGLLGILQETLNPYVPPRESQVRHIARVVAANPLSFFKKVTEIIRDEIRLKDFCIKKIDFPDVRWHFTSLVIEDLLVPWGANGAYERLHLASVLRMGLRQSFNFLCFFDTLKDCDGEGSGLELQAGEKESLEGLSESWERRRGVVEESVRNAGAELFGWVVGGVILGVALFLVVVVLVIMLCVEKALTVRRMRQKDKEDFTSDLRVKGNNRLRLRRSFSMASSTRTKTSEVLFLS